MNKIILLIAFASLAVFFTGSLARATALRGQDLKGVSTNDPSIGFDVGHQSPESYAASGAIDSSKIPTEATVAQEPYERPCDCDGVANGQWTENLNEASGKTEAWVPAGDTPISR